MRYVKTLITVMALGAGVLGPGAGLAGRAVSADDSTSSPTAVVETPAETVVVETPEVPTVAPPVIRRERTPLPVPTVPVPTPVPTAVPPRTTAVPAVTAQPAPGAGVVYDPSPAELRLNARLRWGKRIPPAVRRWAFLVVPAARRYGVDPNLIAAVITMESAGDPSAWNSGSDARGLMQVLHGPFDPAENIDAGTRMLAGFLHEFKDLPLALAAYNAGPGAVLQYNGVPPYRETRDYVIIVGYLYDLYSHRSLTDRRKEQFSATVRDLHRFANQRKKIRLLATTANVQPEPARSCTPGASCLASFDERVFPTMDPFWPMPGPPDPLQHVGTAVSPR